MTQLTRLYLSLEEAFQTPQTAVLSELCQKLDAAIVDLDDQSLLKVAGDAIAQLATILAMKAGISLEEVIAIASQDGPVMRLEEFEGYVRQTMQIDLDSYIESIPLLEIPQPPEQPWSAWQAYQEYQAVESSIVSEVSTAMLEDWLKLLQELTHESEAAEMEQIKQLSHGEDIEAWSEMLRACLAKLLAQRKKDRVGASLLPKAIAFLDLVKQMKMPASEVWLAFLLGEHDYQLCRKNDDFYSAIGIEVVMRN